MKQTQVTAFPEPVAHEDRRKKRRVRFTGLLPGIFRHRSSGSVFSCRPVDVSEIGLGVLSSHGLEIGDEVVIESRNEEILLVVQWKKQDFGKHDLWRYGLAVHDRSIDLVEVFSSTGCIR